MSAEGEAYFGHLDLLLLWHFVEAHAQPWFLQLAAGLPSPLSSTMKKCIGKTKLFPFGGAQYASFFQMWFTTDRGKNWGLASLQNSLWHHFLMPFLLGFFDLNRWWIQQETAPRFYTFGHLRQHPALGALYRVFWPSFRHPTKTLRLEVGCLGGWMSNKMGVAIAKLCTLLGAEFNALQYINIHRVSKSFFIGLHLSLLCRRFRRVRF